MFHELPQTDHLYFDFKINQNDRRLTLTSHHLSFYEELDPENPLLSEYHYTAYFTDGTSEYQLHVYFDKNDQIVMASQLSIKNDDLIFESINTTEEQDHLLQELAQEKSPDAIGLFRKLFKEQISRDSIEYDAQISRVQQLSAQIETNPQKYLAEVERTITLIESFLRYRNNRYYQSVLSLFKNIVLNMQDQDRKKFEVAQENKTQSVVVSSGVNHHLELDQAPLVARPKQEIVLGPILNQAKEAYGAFSALKSSKAAIEMLVQSINASYILVQEALGTSITPGCECTALELEQLRDLIEQHQQTRQKLLETCLLNNKFKEAELLSGVANKEEPLLPQVMVEKLVHLALVTRNPKLLEFLLNHHHFPVNTFKFNGLSAVQFCLSNNTKEKPLHTCLSVLINNGASLMELDPKIGLPIAHIILSTPAHSLKEAFLDNAKSTLLNQSFYKTLIRHLEKIKPSPSKQLNRTIDRAIDEYQTAIVSLSNQQSKMVLRQNEELIAVKDQLESNFSESLSLMLSFDSDIQRKKALLVLAQQEYLACLTSKEKIASKRMTLDLLRELNQIISTQPELSLQGLKVVFIKSLDEQIEECTLGKRLHAVQTSLRAKMSQGMGRKAVPKEIKQLASEERFLIRRIQELTNPRDQLMKASGFINLDQKLTKFGDLLGQLKDILQESQDLLFFSPSKVHSGSSALTVTDPDEKDLDAEEQGADYKIEPLEQDRHHPNKS